MHSALMDDISGFLLSRYHLVFLFFPPAVNTVTGHLHSPPPNGKNTGTDGGTSNGWVEQIDRCRLDEVGR